MPWLICFVLSALLSKLRSVLTCARGARGSSGHGSSVHGPTGRWGYALLIALCAAVYVPGLASIEPVDRDECRFAQASRQMLESVTLPPEQLDLRADPATGRPLGRHAGGLVVPMVQTTPRLNKPPLIYWLQALSAGTLTLGDPARDAIWMYRLPSALCALASVLLTWRLGLRLFDARAALLAAALLAVSPMVVWDAHQARADQLLLATTTATMYCLWRCLHAEASARRTSLLLPSNFWSSLLWPALLWLSLGLGVLAKGFITPLVLLGAVLALCAAGRSLTPLRATRPWLALMVLPLVVSPWLLLIAERIGIGPYARLVWAETFLRAAAGSKEGHFAPPGTHLVMLAALFWPGSLLTLIALRRAVRVAWGSAWPSRQSATPSVSPSVSPSVTPSAPSSARPGTFARLRVGLLAMAQRRPQGRAAELFCLAWIIPAWVVFELSLAKLPHYTLPLYPPIALLSARAIFAATARRDKPDRPGLLIWLLIGLAAGLGAIIAWALAPHDPARGTPTPAIAACVLIALLAGSALLLAARAALGHHWLRAQWLGVLAAAIGLALSLQFLAPAVAPGATTAAVMRALAAQGLQNTGPLASTYREDSMVFSTRGLVQRIAPADARTWLIANPTGVLITADASDAAARPGASVTPVPGASRPLWIVYAPRGP